MTQKTQKWGSAWANDTIKQKSSDSSAKKYSRLDVKAVEIAEPNNEAFTPKKIIPVTTRPINSKLNLFEIPTVSKLHSFGMGILLNRLENGCIKEDEIPWSEESLFAEIINEISKEKN